VIVQPVVRIHAADQWERVDEAIAKLDRYDDVVFTSSNGVDYFLERLESLGRDVRALAGVRLVAVGPGTAAALARFHLSADLQPTDAFSAESLLQAMQGGAAGRRVLLVRGSRGRQTLGDGLRQQGATVDQVVVYQSEDEAALMPEVTERLGKAVRPWILVTSSAIAASAVRLLGPLVGPDARWISISPLTSHALRQAGIEPACEATRATMSELIETLVAAAARLTRCDALRSSTGCREEERNGG
jgi:uroporphyrinogen III methyltransferase/synthase